MHTARLVAAATLFLAGCTSTIPGLPPGTDGADEATPADVLTLRFDWSTVQRAEVRTKRAQNTVRPDLTAPHIRRSKASWTWRVVPDGAGWAVRTRDHLGTSYEPDPAPTNEDRIDDPLDVLAEAVPSVRLDATGSPVEVTDGDVVRQAFARSAHFLPEAAKARLRGVPTDDAALLQHSRVLWDVIRQWDGRRLERGKTQQSVGSTAVVELGGSVLEEAVDVTWTEWVPCTETDREQRCIELRSRAVVESTEGLPAGVSSWTRVVEVTVVTTPATLVPRSAEWRWVGSRELDGEASATSHSDTRSWTFDWKR